MNGLKLIVSHYKILETIYLLNEDNCYPTSQGIYKILHGIMDEETMQFYGFPTFSTLISFSRKKVSRFVSTLAKYGYLTQEMSIAADDIIFAISPLGIAAFEKYIKKQKKPYTKKANSLRPTIVRIEK